MMAVFENDDNPGVEMYELIKELYPICRSITGNGVRETLSILKKHIPLDINEVPSGTEVFDWKVPKEWNIKDAYIKNSKGERIVDFKKSNLHVLSYSTPINKKISLAELVSHLYSVPKYPDWIPYLTSYYKENWGFCLTHNQLKNLPEDTYEVVIDSNLENGHLTYGEILIRGEVEDEILFSCYICHPSMANDNLSGPVLLTFLAREMMLTKHHYSYRFIFVPETIGALTWLSKNEDGLALIKAGFVVTCVGDPGAMTYKRSKMGVAYIDRVVEKVLADSGKPYTVVDFFPTGGDERQFSSPGFNLPVGSLVRTLYGRFPEYHTSADNFNFVTAVALEDSLMRYREVVMTLEADGVYLNQNPKGEPQLGKRGLYNAIGGLKSNSAAEQAILWVLSFSDGTMSLLDIAVRSGLPFRLLMEATQLLVKHDLLRPRS